MMLLQLNCAAVSPNQGTALPVTRQREVVIIDPSVPNYLLLAEGITPGAEMIILNPNRDGVEEITEILSRFRDIEALHIISHGEPGQVHLSQLSLSSDNLSNYTADLQKWRKALKEEAFVLLYGCRIAQGSLGRNFLEQLQQFLGTHLAANPRLTGSDRQEGTWILQPLRFPTKLSAVFEECPVSCPPPPFTPSTLATYPHLLSFNFYKRTFVTIDHSPFAITNADFNGDGKPDLATANWKDDTVSILLNTTPVGAMTAGFTPQQTFATGKSPRTVISTDINGDDKLDLVVGCSLGISVLLNTTPVGATTAAFTPQQTFAFNANLSSIINDGVDAIDFNNDDKLDLVVAQYNSTKNLGTISILFNTTPLGSTSATFAPQPNVEIKNGPFSIASTDFNSDGKTDLALFNTTLNQFSYFILVLPNTTPPEATTPIFNFQNIAYDDFSRPTPIISDDFNQDGKTDLAITRSLHRGISVLSNTTPPGADIITFSFQNIPLDSSYKSAITGIANADFDNDGKPDLAVANSSEIFILFNTTPQNSTTANFSIPHLAYEGIVAQFTTADFNSDGKSDLATLSGTFTPDSTTNSVSILFNVPSEIYLVTATPSEGKYGPGSVINITVTFSDTVTVNTEGGIPQLQLETGTIDRFATYISGSGSRILTFEYVVQPGDNSPALDYLSINSLQLNGSTIKDSTNLDAVLTLPTSKSFNSLKRFNYLPPLVIDALPPTVTLNSATDQVDPTSSDAVNFTVTFSEPVTGFDTSDLILEGTAHPTTAVISGTGPVYQVAVSGMTSSGTVTASVRPKAAIDEVGNPSEASTSTDNSVTYAVSEIEVFDGTTPILDGTTTAVDFGTTPYGTPVTRTLTIKNTGLLPLNLSNFDLPTGFHWIGTPPSSIGPQETGDFQLQLAANTTDPASGTLVVATNDSDENPFDFSVTGKVIPVVQVASEGKPSETGPTKGTYQISLQGCAPASGLALNYSLAGTATRNVDYSLVGDANTTVTDSTITIAAGQTSGTIQVVPVDDNEVENAETVVLTLTPDPAYGLGASPSASLAIADNDTEVTTSVPNPTSTSLSVTDRDTEVPVSATTSVPTPTSTSLPVGETPLTTNSPPFWTDNSTLIPDCLCSRISYPVNFEQFGGNDNDWIWGDRGNELLNGGRGNDTLWGNEGNDTLWGNEGNDWLSGGKGDDFLDGGKDNDEVFAGKGNDLLVGATGDDLLSGNQGGDTLCGQVGNDLLLGGKGDDFLDGCEGNDTLLGGQNRDIFVLSLQSGLKTIADFTLGDDRMGLLGGLRFEHLEFESFNSAMLIRLKSTGQALASLTTVNASALTAQDFQVL